MNNAADSYDRQARQEDLQVGQGRIPDSLLEPDTVDAWRHRRMHDMLLPVLSATPDAEWLTVGDGNYGTDAHYLHSQGVKVIASSLTDGTLKISKEKGYIPAYQAVNAEDIPYEENAFDYVLCKEAYHHFPRPAIAFYEMLRVANAGVVLIEPFDGSKRLLEMIKEPAKKLLWGKGQTIHFEPSGNFIYRISPKQMGKKLAALGYAAVAYKTFNDIYLPRFGKAKCGMTAGHLFTKLAIFLQDVLCAFRLLNPGLVTMVCFKQIPSEKLTQEIKRAGFTFDVLPVNPYT